MLRITSKKEGEKRRILYLEGKISQDWVKELDTEIKKGIDKGEKVILDFLRVRYLDDEAAEMLSRFSAEKVEKRNCSLFIQEMLELNKREGK